MQHIAASRVDDLPHTLLSVLDDPSPVFLNAPSGSGKTFVLKKFAKLLVKRGAHCVYVDAASGDAERQLATAPPRSVFLLDNCELAPSGVLQAACAQLLTGSPLVCAVTESHFSSEYGKRLNEVLERMPELEDTLDGAHNIRISLASDSEIARLAHRRSKEQLDSVTVDAIEQLAWGRPGWALDLLQLHRNGALMTDPLPKIRWPQAAELRLPSFRHPIRTAESRLSSEEIAAAIVLADVGPRSASGVHDIVGSSAQSKLFSSGILISTPGAPELYGVPELYAAALQPYSDAADLAAARTSAAELLLSQEAFGIPLADREAVFCARVLSRYETGVSADSMLAEHHAAFLRRLIEDLVSFGQGGLARDLMLRLGRLGPGLSLLARGRLTTVLRDAHTGLQVLLASDPPRSNCDLPCTDREVRFGTLLLQGRLAAESGLALEPDPAVSPDDRVASDAHLVARRWNDDRPIGGDSIELRRIARSHPQQEVALLAELLLALEAVFFGLRYRDFDGKRIEQQISRLAIDASEVQRDALETAVVVYVIVQLFSPERSQEELNLFELVGRLPGASRHRVWATHAHAAWTALVCGDYGRAELEWSLFVRRLPRFIPWRLHKILVDMGDATPPGGKPDFLRGFAGQILDYFTGRLEGLHREAFSDPLRHLAQLGVVADPASLEEVAARAPIRAHLEASRTQNPNALLRTAGELESYSFWGPAAYALQEARSIFMRRRAAGSVTATDARIDALKRTVADQVPWFDAGTAPRAPRERLTPRETLTAQLAASGLSNRDIAARLNCSVRTVESHLSQARAKLGVSKREELRARLEALGLAFQAGDDSPGTRGPSRIAAKPQIRR